MPTSLSPQKEYAHRGFFLYSRKSSEDEDRQILSIESQIRELKEVADRMRIPILEILSEARSAKEPGRPIFNEMMRRIKQGEADGILCWKLDRLSRNPVEGGDIIWVVKKYGIEIVTPYQTYKRDDGKTLMMYLELGSAHVFIDDLSRNVKRGLRAKLEKGWFPSVAPLGYLNNFSRDKGDRAIIPDPTRFPLIRKMSDFMLTGNYSPPQIAKMANQEWGFRTRPMKRLGLKPLNRSMIYRIFNNSFYAGHFEYPRGSHNWHQGAHKRMISRDEYDRVQVLLGRKGKPRMNDQVKCTHLDKVKWTHPLRGL